MLAHWEGRAFLNSTDIFPTTGCESISILLHLGRYLSPRTTLNKQAILWARIIRTWLNRSSTEFNFLVKSSPPPPHFYHYLDKNTLLIRIPPIWKANLADEWLRINRARPVPKFSFLLHCWIQTFLLINRVCQDSLNSAKDIFGKHQGILQHVELLHTHTDGR